MPRSPRLPQRLAGTPLPSEHRLPPFPLTLTEVAPGGDAVGRRDDGLVVFVPGGTPGDEVLVQLVRSHRSYAHGRLLRLLTPGPLRVSPPCALALPAQNGASAACGGCPLMAMGREAQLAAKQAWVTRAMRQLPIETRPILAPAADQGYRLRARLLLRDGRLGFAAAGSHHGSQPSTCPVLLPALSRVLFERCQVLIPALGEGGALSGLAGWHNGQPAIHLALEPASPSRTALGTLRQGLAQLLSTGDIVGASLRTASAPSAEPELHGVPYISLLPPGDPEALGPLWGAASGFAQACQAGHTLLPRLVAEATRAIADSDGTTGLPRVLELFSGSGNLSRALCRLTDELICVEGDAAAVDRARAALGTKPRLLAEPVTDALRRLRREAKPPTVIVLDPPRAGAAEAMPLIAELAPRRVVYVSCDVMTLARDLGQLRAHGYVPRYVQPIDLMPHTAEIECIAVCDASDPRAS